MKKITLTLAAFVAAISMNAQTVLFEEDFETYDNFIIENIGDWTTIDNDGLGTYGFNGIDFENEYYTGSFIVFNPTATTPPMEAPDTDVDWTARSGNKSLTSFAAVVEAGQGNDDWLISPQVQLGNSGNVLSFWAKAAVAEYANETFSVGISTTDTNPDSFTMIATDEVPTAINWEEFTFDLDDYAGEEVYIAIHHTAVDQFGFQVDDFMVTADDVASIADFAAYDFSYAMNNSRGELTMNANIPMSNVKLYNVLGQNVLNQKLNAASTTLDLNNLTSGVYIVQVEMAGKVGSFKIAKK